MLLLKGEVLDAALVGGALVPVGVVASATSSVLSVKGKLPQSNSPALSTSSSVFSPCCTIDLSWFTRHIAGDIVSADGPGAASP